MRVASKEESERAYVCVCVEEFKESLFHCNEIDINFVGRIFSIKFTT